jgi:hypothetical protein
MVNPSELRSNPTAAWKRPHSAIELVLSTVRKELTRRRTRRLRNRFYCLRGGLTYAATRPSLPSGPTADTPNT